MVGLPTGCDALGRPTCSFTFTCSSALIEHVAEQRFRNSMPKMYSLNSAASILPRRMSAALNRWRSSCGRVSGIVRIV